LSSHVEVHENPASKRQSPAIQGNRIFEHWQCSCCDTVNSAKLACCKKCAVKCGEFSVSDAHCGLCNMVVYIPEEKISGVTCPMCLVSLYCEV